MNLKIFVPDIQHKIERKICVLPLIPFVTNDLSQEQRIERFGGWINRIQFVDAVEDCDIVMPAHYVNYYASRKKLKVLAQMNTAASHAGKPTVCWTNGDWGVTPKLNHFHLYRLSGYHSSNEGNQFCYPFFLGDDPLHKYYRGILPLYKQKPEKPLIGFCGRASNNMLSTGMDITKNLGRAALKIAGRWPEDTEHFYGSSSSRYRMLKALEKSPLVDTNFILHKAFKGGERNAEDKKRLSELFYTNMKQSHYVFCYRGWGNYSIRLYEALACGRIPFIIDSDSNFLFPDEINWNMFPIANHSQTSDLAAIISQFHTTLTNDDFINLQYRARGIWEQYCTYRSFMEKWANKYLKQ